MSRCILRDIHAEIIHIDLHAGNSPAYVLSVRPKSVGHVAAGLLPTHTIARTYSEWRRLYSTLLLVSSCTNCAACTCTLGACPFWTMHLILETMPFPPKVLFRRRSRRVLEGRKRGLAHFLTCILAKLQVYRPEHFEASGTVGDSASTDRRQRGCLFLHAIEAFLGMDDDAVNRQLFASVGPQNRLKLNLQGWHSDRQNLYFLNGVVAASP
ncbi:Aste57867_12844 [Aphanomyces stellatus]|uniref:Aste57867_12844 protein n=1 Tax=Aphanomyces stellatus TaxID=120398 RepID=A0A485KYM5_9STRA|nr:hypothetical protein As57867_012796 [Aphanomyces stellatus]VFT89691.1 Aste57867_12844 [Aphanomyces stellatus]